MFLLPYIYSSLNKTHPIFSAALTCKVIIFFTVSWLHHSFKNIPLQIVIKLLHLNVAHNLLYIKKHRAQGSDFAKVTAVGDWAEKESTASAAGSGHPHSSLLVALEQSSTGSPACRFLMPHAHLAPPHHCWPGSNSIPENKLLQSQMETIKRAGGAARSHITRGVFSDYSESHARLNRGNEQREALGCVFILHWT